MKTAHIRNEDLAADVADPHGHVQNIHDSLPADNVIRKSMFARRIIALRLQGQPFQTISNFLKEQGYQHRISPSTLSRYLSNLIKPELSLAEEDAESAGEQLHLDLEREISGQILAQRKRVDAMQKAERMKQEGGELDYTDPNIRPERALLNDMMKTLQSIRKGTRLMEEDDSDSSKKEPPKFLGDEDALTNLREMILNGELSVEAPP